MNDAKFDKWVAKNKAIGHLHVRHPQYLFGAVFYSPAAGEYMLGPETFVPKGLVIRLWSGETFVA